MVARRFLRLFLVLALALAALGALGYWQRVELARGAFNTLVSEGWRLEGLEGLNAGPGGASVDHLVLRDSVSGRRVEVWDLDAGFTLSGLLAHGSLERVSAGRLRIGNAQSQGPASPASIATWLERLRSPRFTELEAGEIRLPYWDLPLSLRATWDADGLTLNLSGGPWRGEANARPAVDGGLEARVTLHRDGRLQADMNLDLRPRQGSAYQLAGSGRLDVQSAVDLPMPFAALSRWASGGELSWSAMIGLPSDLRLLAPEDFQIEIREGAVLHGAAGLLPELTLPRLQLVEPLVLSFAGDFGPALEIIAGEAILRLDSLRYADHGLGGLLTLSGVRVRGGADPRVQLDFAAEELLFNGLPEWLPRLGVTGELALADAEWRFQGMAHHAEAREIVPLRAEGTFEQGAGGRATLALSTQTFSKTSPLSARFPSWPFPYDLAGGELSAVLELTWTQEDAAREETGLRVRLTGNMDELAGYHGEIFFQGLSGPLAGSFDPDRDFPFSTPVLSWEAERLNVGFDLTRLSARFSLVPSPPALAVSSFTANLLGGEVRASEFEYGFGAARNEAEITFHDLRLERVLDLVDYAGVEAVGGVSGTLPIRLEGGLPSLAEGTFQSEPPGGVIRYSPARPEGQAVNPGLSLVEQALSDYRFENIDGTLRYTPSGDVDILMRIQGYNPAMNDGQRINLNLNLSDNLPVLLRSLQAGRTIEDMLEGQL